MDFILKDDMNIVKSRIDSCFETVNKRYNQKGIIKNDKSLSFYSDYTLWKILFDNIIYFETSSIPHKVRGVTNNNKIEFYSSLKNISKVDKCFIRIHQPFVINVNHVLSFNIKDKVVKMDNGDTYSPYQDKNTDNKLTLFVI